MSESFANQAGGAVAKIMAMLSRLERAEKLLLAAVAMSAIALYRTRDR